MDWFLSGIESAILNREPRNSESCDSNRAIPRALEALIGCDSDGDSEAILLTAIPLFFFLLLAAEISGDSRPAILGIVRFAVGDSEALRLVYWRPKFDFYQVMIWGEGVQNEVSQSPDP